MAHDGTKLTISLGKPMAVPLAGLIANKVEDRIENSNAGVVMPRDRDGILWRASHPTTCSASPGKGAPGFASVCGRLGCLGHSIRIDACAGLHHKCRSTGKKRKGRVMFVERDPKDEGRLDQTKVVVKKEGSQRQISEV